MLVAKLQRRGTGAWYLNISTRPSNPWSNHGFMVESFESVEASVFLRRISDYKTVVI